MAKINKKKQYVVLDVETNGLSASRDDLLSISLYKPDDNKTYERYLPLEKQDCIFTSDINGITKRKLKNKKPLSQDELNIIIEEFELQSRTILIYGNLDEKFITQYCLEHNLKGYEKWKFYNFKHDIISSAFSSGNVTKDNLCKVYGIRGIKKVHNGLNDCILEWKLFDKMKGQKLFVINDEVYEIGNEYMISADALSYNTNFKYHVKNLPKIRMEKKEVFTQTIQDDFLFDVSVALILEQVGEVVKFDSKDFVNNNDDKLKYLGNLSASKGNNNGQEVLHEDGEKQVDSREAGRDLFDNFNQNLQKKLEPLICFLKNHIFTDGHINYGELVVNRDSNVYAICGWSNGEAILEWCVSKKLDKKIYPLYYMAAGRRCYVVYRTKDWIHHSITYSISEIIFDLDSSGGRGRKSKNPPKRPMRLREYLKMLEEEENNKS